MGVCYPFLYYLNIKYHRWVNLFTSCACILIFVFEILRFFEFDIFYPNMKYLMMGLVKKLVRHKQPPKTLHSFIFLEDERQGVSLIAMVSSLCCLFALMLTPFRSFLDGLEERWWVCMLRVGREPSE